MERLAAFVESDGGRLYAASCAKYGVDPGALFSDDVVAMNARAAFALQDTDDTVDPDDPLYKAKMVEREMGAWR